MTPYTPPTFKKTAFNCPHCGAYANQFWSDTFFKETHLAISLNCTIVAVFIVNSIACGI